MTPIAIGLFFVCGAFESIIQGGKVSWGVYTLTGFLLLLWPSIFIIIVIRTYELVEIHASKTA